MNFNCDVCGEEMAWDTGRKFRLVNNIGIIICNKCLQ